MKSLNHALICACLALAAGAASAQGAIGNGVPQPKSKPPTVEECNARAPKAEGAKKTSAEKRMDKACVRVLKKAEAKK